MTTRMFKGFILGAGGNVIHIGSKKVGRKKKASSE